MTTRPHAQSKPLLSEGALFDGYGSEIECVSSKAKVWRREMHRHPEIGFDEHWTTDYIRNRLGEMGIDDVQTLSTGTGVVAVVEGKPGPVFLLRADIDALPIHEQSDADYRSNNAGAMHACGHDGHSAILLATADILSRYRNFAGTAVLLFQPAEEMGLRGAQKLIDAGFLNTHRPEIAFALHCWPGIDVGSIGIPAHYAMAAYDTFEIEFEGRGGHGAQPHLCQDPVPALGATIQSLHNIVSRAVDPQETAALSVCQVNSGSAISVIPDRAYLAGSVRTFSPDVRSLIADRVEKIVAAQAEAFELRADLDYQMLQPAVINERRLVQTLTEVLSEGPASILRDVRPGHAGEDFSFFSERVPSVFFFLGNGPSEPLHSTRFDFEDEAILFGVDAFLRIAFGSLAVNKFNQQED